MKLKNLIIRQIKIREKFIIIIINIIEKEIFPKRWLKSNHMERINKSNQLLSNEKFEFLFYFFRKQNSETSFRNENQYRAMLQFFSSSVLNCTIMGFTYQQNHLRDIQLNQQYSTTDLERTD